MTVYLAIYPMLYLTIYSFSSHIFSSYDIRLEWVFIDQWNIEFFFMALHVNVFLLMFFR